MLIYYGNSHINKYLPSTNFAGISFDITEYKQRYFKTEAKIKIVKINTRIKKPLNTGLK